TPLLTQTLVRFSSNTCVDNSVTVRPWSGLYISAAWLEHTLSHSDGRVSRSSRSRRRQPAMGGRLVVAHHIMRSASRRGRADGTMRITLVQNGESAANAGRSDRPVRPP